MQSQQLPVSPHSACQSNYWQPASSYVTQTLSSIYYLTCLKVMVDILHFYKDLTFNIIIKL